MAYLTEKELLERYEFYIIQLEEQLLEGEDIGTIGEQIPFAIQLNNPVDFKSRYMNQVVEEFSGFAVEEIQENWDEYLKIVHPKTVESMLQFLPAFYSNQKPRHTLSFVQHVKFKKKKEYTPVISFTKPSVLPGGSIIWLTINPGDLEKLAKPMQQIVRMDKFKLDHFKKFQRLTNREVEVLKLLANGGNNARIAEELYLSGQTVETHRKNIKRKLELRSFLDLMRYAFAFNLIDC